MQRTAQRRLRAFVERLEIRSLLSGGARDLGYGVNGVVTSESASMGAFFDQAAAAGGKLLASSDGFVARFTPAGQLDPTFGSGGRIQPFTSSATKMRMAVGPDGTIVVMTGGTGSAATSAQFKRFFPDGSPDLSFGTAGGTTVMLPSAGVTYGMGGLKVMGDGSVVAFTTRNYLFHLLPTGQVDTAFGSAGNGIATYSTRYAFRDVLPRADGSILASMVYLSNLVGTGGTGYPAVAHLDHSGAVDMAFGTANGLAPVTEGDREDPGNARLLARSDGKVYLLVGWLADTSVVLFNADGTRDSSYGSGGVFHHSFADFFDLAYDGVVLSDDSLTLGVVAGRNPNFTNKYDTILAHVSVVGTTDVGFGVSGTAVLNLTNTDFVRGVVQTSDGKLIVNSWTGADSFSSPAKARLARFSPPVAPTQAASLDAVTHQLRVITSAAADNIILQSDGAYVSVTVNADASVAFARADIDSIFIAAGDGSDLITIDSQLAAGVQVFGEGGLDQLHLSGGGNGVSPIYTAADSGRFDRDGGREPIFFDHVESIDGGAEVNSPRIASVTFDYQYRLAVMFDWSESVGTSVMPEEVVLTRDGVQIPLNPSAVVITTLSSGASRVGIALQANMPPGLYQVCLPAGIAEDGQGTPNSQKTAFEFAYSPGDTGNDGVVDFTDLIRLAQNFGKTGVGRSLGDVDYSGVVDFGDLLAVSQNFAMSESRVSAILDRPKRGIALGRNSVGEDVLATTGTTSRNLRASREEPG